MNQKTAKDSDQRASFDEQLPLENPFYHRTPIRDQRFFFGRTAETRRVLSLVAMRQPVSIVGSRRIGKSSLLFHLCDPQVKAAHGLGDDHVFVYIDCQVLSEDLTKSDVYRMLLEETAKLAQGDCSAEYGSREPMTYLDFERCLDDITTPGCQIVFLFDEFESIADNRQLGRDFFEELRGLGQTGQVVYVTASGETVYDLSFHDENVLSSPFFNIFSTVWLGFMKPQEARALVDGLAAMADFEGFDEDDHAFLQDIAGPHPFYLQVACYLLFEEKTGKARSAGPDYDLVRSQFAREMRGHFRHAWTRLSNDEQKALRLIGEGRPDGISSEDMERLEQKCLVYQGQIFSSVFAGFVLRSAAPAMDATGMEPVVVHRLDEVWNHLNRQVLQSQSLAVVGRDSELKRRLLRELVRPVEGSAYYLFGGEESFRSIETDRRFAEEDIQKITSSYIFGDENALDALRDMLTGSQRTLLQGYDGYFKKVAILDFVREQPQATRDTLLIIGDRFDEILEISYLPELFKPGTISLVPTSGKRPLDLIVSRICESAESVPNKRCIFVFDDPNCAQSPISTLKDFPFVTFWLLPSSYDTIRGYRSQIDNFIVLKAFVQPALDALEEDLGISEIMEHMRSSCFVALGDFSPQSPLLICLEEGV